MSQLKIAGFSVFSGGSEIPTESESSYWMHK